MKKAQAQVIKSIIVVVMIGVIVLFGFKTIRNLGKKSCTAGLVKFGAELENLYVQRDAIEIISMDTPCDVDTIYFVDLNEEVDFALLNRPLMQDSVEDNIEKNVFLYTGKEFVGSFYIERLSVDSPRYACFDTRRKKLEMKVEGFDMRVIHKDNKLNCGPIKIGLSFEESLPNEIFGSAQERQDFLAGSSETMESIELFRAMRVEDGKTRIDVAIRPREGFGVRDLSYVEWIDKECIESLEAEGIEFTGPVPTRTVDDPVIMWHFDQIEQSGEVSYTLDDPAIAERCRELISAVASATQITPPPETDLTVNEPPPPVVPASPGSP
ncbi:hypothetical protein KY360_04465 [Candidatus Woesearchaeota archaeon]|nr:hypothetical protein [Candidatus Woesearchaeota archaeon]